MRTKFLQFIVFILFAISAIAQSPQALKYQGIARDISGNALVNKNISLRITIHQDSATGTGIYIEKFSTTTNQFGLFNINVGTGTVLTGTFSAIKWNQNSYWQETEMDPNGGNTFTSMGTSQFLSVPYALVAGQASNGGFSNMQVFNSTGTFTIPSNVTKIMVEVWGGGAGGVGAGNYPGCGGGYGKQIFAVQPGTNYTITIGAGGIGSNSSTAAPGGTTSFGSLISATGGSGASGGTSSATFSIQGSYGNAAGGGNGANGGGGSFAYPAGIAPGGAGGASNPGGNGASGRVVVWW